MLSYFSAKSFIITFFIVTVLLSKSIKLPEVLQLEIIKVIHEISVFTPFKKGLKKNAVLFI